MLTRGALSRHRRCHPPSFGCCPVGPQPRIRGEPKAARRVKEEAKKKERYGKEGKKMITGKGSVHPFPSTAAQLSPSRA